VWGGIQNQKKREIAKDGGKSEIPFFGSAALKERAWKVSGDG
jgi:hypothetical protein